MADSPRAQPRAGVDYPRALLEFGEFLPDEQACATYLERLRWGEQRASSARRIMWPPWLGARAEASLCAVPVGRQVSATAGTIFEGIRKLRQWFLVAWGVTRQQSGVNALGSQRAVGLELRDGLRVAPQAPRGQGPARSRSTLR
jgi:hypothetical protein